MYNIAIAVASGIAVFLLVAFAAGWSVIASILPALIVMVAAYYFLAQRTMKQVQALMEQVNKAVTNQKMDRAISILQSALPLGKWQILVEPQIRGQIGQLLYVRGDFDDALGYLEKSWLRDHMSQCLYAACLYQKRRYEDMERVLETASIANKKTAFVWALYAFLMEKVGKKDLAVAKLAEGLKHCPGDEDLSENLLNLQNGRRMKMKRFGDVWYAFQLEPHPMRVARPPKFAAFRR